MHSLGSFMSCVFFLVVRASYIPQICLLFIEKEKAFYLLLSPNNTATEILLKVALNTKNQLINQSLDNFIYFNNENYSVPLRPNITGMFIRWYFKGEHLSSPPVFSGVRVTRSLVLCVCFVDRCLPFCPFSFGHYVICPSSIYGFWFTLLVSSNSSCGTDP